MGPYLLVRAPPACLQCTAAQRQAQDALSSVQLVELAGLCAQIRQHDLHVAAVGQARGEGGWCARGRAGFWPKDGLVARDPVGRCERKREEGGKENREARGLAAIASLTSNASPSRLWRWLMPSPSVASVGGRVRGSPAEDFGILRLHRPYRPSAKVASAVWRLCQSSRNDTTVSTSSSY